jgi:dihydroflavonol-4-reductase
MKTLVTGGTGYVGSSLVRLLLEQGEEVRCLVREGSRTANIDGLPVEIARGDVGDEGSLRRSVKGCGRVYHLAALYANWVSDPSLMYRVNVDGTRNVLQACREGEVERVVHCSSVAALGAHGKTPADESASFNLQSTQDPYYLSKHGAEQVALEFAASGLPLVIVNPSNPLGPRDRTPTPTGALILHVLRGALPGYVEGGINLITMTDCVRGMAAAMERGRPGERYVLGNRNVSVKEYFDLIVAVAGKGRSPSIRFPRWMAVLSGHGYELLARVTGKPPVTTASWVRVGSHTSWWDCRKAREELGLPQTPVEEGLAEALRWFEQNGYL